MNTMTRLAIALLFVLSIVAVLPVPTQAASGQPKGVPNGAVEALASGYKDGDKLEIKLSGQAKEVLLLLIDAPEPNECYHQQSQDHLSDLAPRNATVYLVRDPAADDTDSKGRLLRHVYVPGDKADDDYRLLNLTMIEDGYAGYRAMGSATLHETDYLKAESKARDDDHGLWGMCGGELHSDRQPAKPTNTPRPRSTSAPRPTATTANAATITDCSPFASYDAAQAYYGANPDAQPVIDPDFDGYACEVYFGIDPTGGAVADSGGATDGGGQTTGAGAPAAPADTSGGYTGGDRDCADFGSQAEAQGAWESAGGSAGNNVWGLDRDHDGVACESLP